MPDPIAAIPPDASDHEADHCACGLEHLTEEETTDAELPPAVGGIETPSAALDSDEHIDGCNLDFNEDEPTTDEELPVTIGG